ncbi:MAG: hypothetical protein C0467_22305 [Planctomycetaceae bacterium]|nr:hypothetical protein [Planctomycetaceae bacterium]
MRWLLPLVLFSTFVIADEKPPLKITPGKVIIPTDKMRRPWGELVSIDLKTRTGTFRNEGDDTLMPFTVMPYAELLHHVARGDLQDFKVGERAIFRLHEDADGKWVNLTYIQDEMNFQAGHKEYYWVDSIDEKAGKITFTQANADKSFTRQTGLVLETDDKTRYWKKGKPAAFADIKVGDKLLAKTHGLGKGKNRVCWEIFLDDESRDLFKAEQLAVHAKRMETEGLPGYIETAEGDTLKLTLFSEGGDIAKKLKAGQKVLVAPAGVDRKPSSEATPGTIATITARGQLHEVVVTTKGGTTGFKPTGLARVWADKPQ